jgi:hypothetical protein
MKGFSEMNFALKCYVPIDSEYDLCTIQAVTFLSVEQTHVTRTHKWTQFYEQSRKLPLYLLLISIIPCELLLWFITPKINFSLHIRETHSRHKSLILPSFAHHFIWLCNWE